MFRYLTETALLWIILLYTSCSTDPRPIRVGEDACNYCKMTVADARFGTEIIMRTGKYYIFDDTHCMLAFVQEQAISREDIKEILVSDYQSPHNLIPVASAYFMQGGNVRGPMGGDLAAFADSTERDRFLNDSGGNTIRWDEIF